MRERNLRLLLVQPADLDLRDEPPSIDDVLPPTPLPPEGLAAGHEPGGGGRRTAQLVAAIVLGLAAAMVAAVVLYATRGVEVTLVVDGETQSLDSRASTVGELLDDEQITVGAADFITPAAITELADDMLVEVRHAREITVLIDDVGTAQTTTALTVGEALAGLDTPLDGSAVSPPPERGIPLEGLTIEVTTQKTITLDDGGEARPATSTAKTVGDLLDDEGVALGAEDVVTPAVDTVITPDMTISIARITVETETRTEPVAYDTVETEDAALPTGTRAVDTEGTDGEQEATYAVTYTNGERTSEELIEAVVTREPVAEDVRVGTGPAPVDPGITPSVETASLNWAALADCESSGNPTAVNPAGYYGLYQFSLPTWASVGGVGNPADASVEEQTLRAHILYERSGPGQWPHCGPRLFG